LQIVKKPNRKPPETKRNAFRTKRSPQSVRKHVSRGRQRRRKPVPRKRRNANLQARRL
jgi:hypothetical protein